MQSHGIRSPQETILRTRAPFEYGADDADDFRIVSNVEGVRLTANVGEVTTSDVGASVTSVSDVHNLC